MHVDVDSIFSVLVWCARALNVGEAIGTSEGNNPTVLKVENSMEATEPSSSLFVHLTHGKSSTQRFRRVPNFNPFYILDSKNRSDITNILSFSSPCVSTLCPTRNYHCHLAPASGGMLNIEGFKASSYSQTITLHLLPSCLLSREYPILFSFGSVARK